MGDPYYGHRNPLTGEAKGDPKEWTDWDYVLMRALQVIEDFTNSHGLLVYEVDDPKGRVSVTAEKRIDEFEAAKAARTAGKRYKASPGEYFVPKLSKRSAEWPTLEEYIEHQIALENETE